MKTLSIQQPWASAIMAGVKRVENRVWSDPYRGPLLIHASKKVDPAGANILKAAGVDVGQFADAPRGAIIGVVKLVAIIRFGAIERVQRHFLDDGLGRELRDDVLAFGPYCWILENPRPLPEPVPWRGRLKLFDVDLPGMDG